jgi:hypothetical protein
MALQIFGNQKLSNHKIVFDWMEGKGIPHTYLSEWITSKPQPQAPALDGLGSITFQKLS